MAELWNASTFTYKQVSSVPCMIAWRATTTGGSDTLTLPCKDIIAHVETNETTNNTLKVTKGTGTSINQLTITCTASDTISGIAIVTK